MQLQTQWCIDCGDFIPEEQRQFSICPTCVTRRITKANEAERLRLEELEREEHRSELTADRFRAQMYRQYLDAKREKE